MTNNALSGSQVRTWLNEFCLRYFQLRDPEGTLALLSPNFISVGTGDGEVAVNKEQFRRLLLEELQVLPWPMSYQIEDYAQNQRAPSCWDCFCSVRLGLDQPEHGLHVTYRIRLTAGVHQEEDGMLNLLSICSPEAQQGVTPKPQKSPIGTAPGRCETDARPNGIPDLSGYS